jgi:hypothetical protein
MLVGQGDSWRLGLAMGGDRLLGEEAIALSIEQG